LNSRLTFVLVVAGLMMVGCDVGRKAVYPVSGQVVDTAQKPAAGAMVVFHPVGGTADAPRAVGTVDDAGRFTLTTYVQGDGAAAGEYAITVIWIPPKRTPVDPEQPDRLGGRYARPDSSPIPWFKVEKGAANQVPTIMVQ